MTIHKAGYILLLKILIVLIILNLASFYFINNTSIVYTILGLRWLCIFLSSIFSVFRTG